MEIQKQRRVGQIIMTCNIIKDEMNRKIEFHKAYRTDLQRWLNADEGYIDTLVEVCQSFDRLNIASRVLSLKRSERLEQDAWLYLCDGLCTLMDYYAAWLLNNYTEEELRNICEIVFKERSKYNVTIEQIMQCLYECVYELVSRVEYASNIDGTELDAVLEIADLQAFSIEDFYCLKEKLCKDNMKLNES